MNYKIIKPENFTTTHWGGGSTTEFYIFPEEANYANRDFLFRLSMATVEVESSTFTPLPGVSRTLMVLNGTMTLTHKGHHVKTLNKFDVDHFKGDWSTQSEGKCSDFNLMTQRDCEGDLEGLSLKEGDNMDMSIAPNGEMKCIYLLKGFLSFVSDEGSGQLSSGELLVLKMSNSSDFRLKADSNVEAVFVSIRLNR